MMCDYITKGCNDGSGNGGTYSSIQQFEPDNSPKGYLNKYEGGKVQ